MPVVFDGSYFSVPAGAAGAGQWGQLDFRYGVGVLPERGSGFQVRLGWGVKWKHQLMM